MFSQVPIVLALFLLMAPDALANLRSNQRADVTLSELHSFQGKAFNRVHNFAHYLNHLYKAYQSNEEEHVNIHPESYFARATTPFASSNNSTSDPSTGSSGLSSGAAAGIAICVIVVVLGGGCCAYRRYRASSASQAGRTKGYVVSEDEDIVIENPVHGRGDVEVRDSRKVLLNDLNL